MIIETGWSGYKYEYPDDRPANPTEFCKLMKALSDNKDGYEETIHGDMDGLMCKLLRDLGYGDGVDVFINTPKWYS